ncbi:MAG TPA: hypothetical protein VE465_17255, partial [Streptosporangiaceae bacterium]|nr:hypothetical protein [Streptosporangiaceae bacterium]
MVRALFPGRPDRLSCHPLLGRWRSRTDGSLIRAAIADLCPGLADTPFTGKPAKGTVPPTFDWRRQYGDQIAGFFRDY